MAAAFMSRFTASVNLLFGLPVDILPADSCTRLYLPLNLLGTKPLSQSAGVMCGTQKGFFLLAAVPPQPNPGPAEVFWSVVRLHSAPLLSKAIEQIFSRNYAPSLKQSCRDLQKSMPTVRLCWQLIIGSFQRMILYTHLIWLNLSLSVPSWAITDIKKAESKENWVKVLGVFFNIGYKVMSPSIRASCLDDLCRNFQRVMLFSLHYLWQYFGRKWFQVEWRFTLRPSCLQPQAVGLQRGGSASTSQLPVNKQWKFSISAC